MVIHITDSQIFSKRIKKVLTELKKTNSSMILSAAIPVTRTHDLHYPFRQNSDFYYLTGSIQPNISLFINGQKDKVYLIGDNPTEHQKIWDGVGENLSIRAKKLDIDYIQTSNQLTFCLNELKNCNTIYLNNFLKNTLAENVFLNLSSRNSLNRNNLPSKLADASVIIHPLRLIKDKDEINLIQQSINITINAILESLVCVQPSSSELLVAKTVEYWFGVSNSTAAFGTIAASGKNASVLHYKDNKSKLKKGDLFLLDCGAEHNMYCGDLTRVYPVSGKFNLLQSELYQIVLTAQEKAIKTIKHNVRIKSVYLAAAKELYLGLKDLKILNGSFESNLQAGSIKKYFPHGIGHSLGIDVHDVGEHRGNNEAILKKNMIFTVEPGLYFSKKIKNIPAMGIRIEDDILVTENGSINLSKALPK
jgi:Xaa-Pro aminopeptidase